MRNETISVQIYTTAEPEELSPTFKTSEDVCIELCKRLGITPQVQPLFCLKRSKSSYWVPANSSLSTDAKYELRIRFKIPDLSTLRQLDRIAFNYYYCQTRHDLINNKIPEIRYPQHKSEIAGLAVADMYKDMIEKSVQVDYLMKNYKSYVPKEMTKKHPIYLKKKLEHSLLKIEHTNHEADYVKTTYLEQINTLSPNLLIEEYTGNAPYPEDVTNTNHTCPVKIRFSPLNDENAGLNIFYTYANQWRNVAKLDNFLTIMVNGNKIRMSLSQAAEFELTMPNKESAESLVTCISGYYRLMHKWNVDLCESFKTPSLQKLMENKCHGPVGGQFSYQKLNEKTTDVGAYILRQCEKEYNTYYIDMRTRPVHIETYKIIESQGSSFEIQLTDTVRESGSNLTDLALLIKCESGSTNQQSKFRVAPTEYDKTDSLLLCMSPEHSRVQRIVNDISSVQVKKPQIIDPERELQLYKKSSKLCDNRIMTQMKAEWSVSCNENLEVTLKILKPDLEAKYSSKLLKMASVWAKVNSMHVIKLFGLSLANPVALVMESACFNPLNEFLASRKKIDPYCLADAALSLAQAIHYLHDLDIVHSRIRCSNVFMSSYVPPKSLRVKLGDQGITGEFTNEDLPWIPKEYHMHMYRAKFDKKADIFAYSTTLWEIFSLGQSPVIYMHKKKILPYPKDCPTAITDIINQGWDSDPDQRFSLQSIFPKLINTKDGLFSNYAELNNHKGSQMSVVTDETELTHRESDVYESSSIDDTESTLSHGSTSTTCSSRFNGYKPNGSNANMSDGCEDPLIEADYMQHLIEIRIFDVGKVKLNQVIGSGNFGIVYKATLEENTQHQFGRLLDVAVKQLHNLDPKFVADFTNEIEIMKSLNHRNIVKIIDYSLSYPVSIVMEYIKDRSLDFYLKLHQQSLTVQKLLKFSRDVAVGMAYLREMNVVHRDLAARNVLVASEECLKISDFGYAKKAGSNGYYTINNENRSIPFRWYAPESMRIIQNQRNVYSFESDVWSFGVTLYEIFSRGQDPDIFPNNQIDPERLYNELIRGTRLQRPHTCPEDIYDKLLFPCWNIKPNLRPNFKTILDTIKELICVYGECIS